MSITPVFSAADILLPRVKEMEKWSAIACDQYTSRPDYWQQAEALVGDAPSTLHMIFPEVYLGKDDDARIASINHAMHCNLENGIFRECPGSFIYVARTMQNGSVREGLVGKIDLEAYDFSADSKSPIRPTEGTVESRLPPRVRIRSNAPLELPHILALIDDPQDTVMQAVRAQAADCETVYDFTLYQSGKVRGCLIPAKKTAPIQRVIDALFAPALQSGGIAIPVGDGNHSLATAKACFEALKTTMPEAQWKAHPARWALVELVNLHQESMCFEPVHRIVFDTDPAALLTELQAAYPVKKEHITLHYTTAAGEGDITLGLSPKLLPVGPLQKFLDNYLQTHAGTLDYIHDDDALRELAARAGTIGIFLPPMQKSALLPSVQQDGALPRKTFSLGHSCEKRFYLEARRIQP